jgi:hypothetical protein
MQHHVWKVGASVPTPARKVKNMFSVRYLGGYAGHAPGLHSVHLEGPERFMRKALARI